MSLPQHLKMPSSPALKCIEMHVTGEPARIVYAGFPETTGTLLEQLAQTKAQHDHIRSRLMLEPRGHADMYGAILRTDTELVRSGEAHIGALFCYNNGYSKFCGHATLALGRFLVDQGCSDVFPNREKLEVNDESATVTINLHAPCGIVKVVVPVTPDNRSDPTRPVTFQSTPSYSLAIDAEIEIPPDLRWPELKDRKSVRIDVSFGGGLFVIVDAHALGFQDGLRNVSLDTMGQRVQRVMESLGHMKDCKRLLQIPSDSFRNVGYGVMLTDKSFGVQPPAAVGAETGLFFFGDNQVDRSPTGSCVCARAALAYTKGQRKIGEPWAYNSLTSNFFGAGAFLGTIVKEVEVEIDHTEKKTQKAVIVEVSGQAFYTGASTLVLEEEDSISQNGFLFKDLKEGLL